MFRNRKSEKCSIEDYVKTVRDLLEAGAYEEGEKKIIEAMQNYPHAPEPHNLYGILLEMKKDHAMAMRHFRAGWALDPSCEPVNVNLYNFGTFSRDKKFAYTEEDCPKEPITPVEIKFDANGVGHTVKQYETQCDANGLVHVVRRK